MTRATLKALAEEAQREDNQEAAEFWRDLTDWIDGKDD